MWWPVVGVRKQGPSFPALEESMQLDEILDLGDEHNLFGGRTPYAPKLYDISSIQASKEATRSSLFGENIQWIRSLAIRVFPNKA